MSGTAPAIEARGLTKRYREAVAVDALDFELRRGALCGFLGPNGAGKTTTLRMLMGLVRPTGGSARVLGHEVRDRAALCRKVGAIIETPAFYPFLSGEKNLRVFADASAVEVPKGRVAALLEKVGLASRARDRVGTYSLGMKQRLGIAAALLTDPELLILDEPTNGLDPAGILEMRALLTQLTAEGKTVLVSSHQLGEVERVCSEVIILQAGKKRFQGPLGALLEEGRRFRFRASPIARAVEVFTAQALDPKVEADAIAVATERAAIPAISRALIQAGVDLFGIEEQQASLERRFLELTGGAR